MWFVVLLVVPGAAVCTVPSGVRTLPVDEFVDDCGVFLAVDEVPVDEKKKLSMLLEKKVNTS